MMHRSYVFVLVILKHALVFSALRYILPIEKSVKFYIISMGLLFYLNMCTSRKLSTTIDPAAYLNTYFLVLVVDRTT